MAKEDTRTAEAREALKQRMAAPIAKEDLLSSGATLLNKACSGRIVGAYAKGKMYLFVGDSDSGKTWLGHCGLAEASISKNFEDFDLVYDAPESGALFSLGAFFGQNLVDRIIPPSGDPANPQYSVTVEQFFFNFHRRIKTKPCVYLLDSVDALKTDSEIKKFEKELRAYENAGKPKQRKSQANGEQEEEVKGTYGVEKAKYLSRHLGHACARLRDTESILIFINQSRMNLGMGAEKTRSGGTALEFYSTIQFWTSIKEKVKRTVKGHPRIIGTLAKTRVKRTRLTGKDRTIYIPILNSHGVDDLKANVDYLIHEGHWAGDMKESAYAAGKVNAPEFKFEGTKEKLIRQIEDEGRERELRLLVNTVWDEIEEACAVQRKSRY